MDEWIQTTADIDTDDQESEQTMTNNTIYQNVHCFDSGKWGHLKRDCRQDIPRDFSKIS